jgi:serine/threonine-protein kinase
MFDFAESDGTDLPRETLDDRYRIIDQLGAGAMGKVYRAEQVSVGRPVAIKVLTRTVANDLDLVQRFRTEAAIISKLRHPNTLKLIDIGLLHDGRLYIVMELLEGEPLDKLIDREAPLEPVRAMRLLRQAADALDEAHQAGVVHRDIKPHNLFLERVGASEVLKVLDFGIARFNNQPTVTASGQVFGTPAYMSPEQVNGLKVDHRSDLYSLGVVAYQCLAGRPPFEADTPVVLMYRHAVDPPPPLSSLGSDVPTSVEALVMKLLAKDPADRFPTAAALVAAIDQVIAELSAPRMAVPIFQRAPEAQRPPAAVVPTAVATRSPAPAPRKAQRVVWAFALAVLGVVGLLAALLSRDPEPIAAVPIEAPPAAPMKVAPPPPAPMPPPVEAARAPAPAPVLSAKKAKPAPVADEKPVKVEEKAGEKTAGDKKIGAKKDRVDAPPGFVGVEL